MKDLSTLTAIAEPNQTVTLEEIESSNIVEDSIINDSIEPDNTVLNTDNQLEQIAGHKPEITNYMLDESNFVGYESKEQQEHVYRLASFGVITPVTKSVLDLGCGRGDFGSYIKRVINQDIKYTGIDVNPLMVQIGTAKHAELGENGLQFKIADYFNFTPTDEYEWVFNNINCTIPYGYHTGDKWAQLLDLIKKSIEYCTIGCVFILLNDKRSYDGFFQYNPGELINLLGDVRYAIDNTDMQDVFKLVIFKQPFI